MRIVAWFLVVLAMAATVGGLGYYKYAQISAAIAEAEAYPEPQETVEATLVRSGEWSATTRAVGTAVAQRRVNLRNELAGMVTEVGFESGAVVEAGQVLVRFDTREEEADLAAALAAADLARQTLERRSRLTANRAASQAELDEAQAALRTAEARLAALRARIDKKTLTAPFRARVGLRDLQPGEFLDAATLITTLQGVEPDAYVDFSLPQDLAATVAVGDTVELSSPAYPGRSVTARIKASDPAVDDDARSVRFRAVAQGLGEVLRPGAFVDVRAVTAEPRPVLLVPLTAVRRAPYGDHVFVLEEGQDGAVRARQRFVKTGPVSGSDIVVTEGLEAGQRIAAKGSFKLREGLLINVASGPNVAAAAVGQ